MFVVNPLSAHQTTHTDVSCEPKSICSYWGITSFIRRIKNHWRLTSIGGKNLFSTNKTLARSPKQLRSFAFIVATGFVIIATTPLILRHRAPRGWALLIALMFGASGVLVPTALRQVYRVWMTAGELLGWVNCTVILGALYYLLFTPIRLLMATAGYDPMNRSFDRNSSTYRNIRKSRPVSQMTHQF